jgi:hypothetical protein
VQPQPAAAPAPPKPAAPTTGHVKVIAPPSRPPRD